MYDYSDASCDVPHMFSQQEPKDNGEWFYYVCMCICEIQLYIQKNIRYDIQW
jgi:hypothetical protein